jgi:ribosomal protein S2
VLTGGLVNKQVDPQVQKLTDELNLMRMKEAKYVAIIVIAVIDSNHVEC